MKGGRGGGDGLGVGRLRVWRGAGGEGLQRAGFRAGSGEAALEGGGEGEGWGGLDVIPKWPEPQCSHHYACACCRVGSSGYTLSLA